VKLNIGGTKFLTSKSTLSSVGTNFFTKLLSEDMPSSRDEEGCYFIDRNGKTFQILLDFLRTGELIIPPTVNERAVYLEADFYSIDLSSTFCPSIRDGAYVYPNERGLVYLERSQDQPWKFGVTGVLKESQERKHKWTELWHEIGTVKEGRLIVKNFEITSSSNQPNCIIVKQLDFFGNSKELKHMPSTGKPGLKSDSWWIGNQFMPNGDYLRMSFVFLEEDQKWVVSLKAGDCKMIGPFDVKVYSSNFIIVDGQTDEFWVFLQSSSSSVTARMLTYNPFWKRDETGALERSEKGWMRFVHGAQPQ